MSKNHLGNQQLHNVLTTLLDKVQDTGKLESTISIQELADIENQNASKLVAGFVILEELKLIKCNPSNSSLYHLTNLGLALALGDYNNLALVALKATQLHDLESRIHKLEESLRLIQV